MLILGSAALYLAGVRRFNRLHPDEPWSGRRTAAFLAGATITFVALELVVGVYDDILFYDHMIQHLLLIMVAAPLYAMGGPLDLLDRATSGRAHHFVVKTLGSRVAEVVGHPLTAFVLYAILIPIAHLTSLFNFALSHGLAGDAEQAAFLVIGYLFWRPVVAIEPTRHPLHPGVRLLYLAAAIPVDTITGIALVSASHELFPYYDTFTRSWGPTRLADLHIGGALMWIGGDGIMALAMIPCLVRWVRFEEQRTAELDAELDAQAAREAQAEHPAQAQRAEQAASEQPS